MITLSNAVACLFVVAGFACAPAAATNVWLDGDIIFQTSLSTQSKAIQTATHSKYSHMGILFQTGNHWYVYEAVGPVKSTALESWIMRGEGGHYVLKRLKDSNVLTKSAIQKLRHSGLTFKDKPYDPYFEWSDDRIYCSELVWKMYRDALGIEIGNLELLKDLDLKSPVVQGKLKERYGKDVPMNEKVITPAAMFNSPALVTVSAH